MAWFFSLSFDPAAQAQLDRLTTSIGLLVTAIGKGTSAMTALKDSADALVSVVGSAITEIGELASKLSAATNQDEVDAVIAELNQAGSSLKAAIDAAAPALPQPASAPPTT